MSFSLERCSDSNKWDEFVRSSPQGSVFSSSSFIQALGVDAHLWLVRENSTPVLGAVVLTQNGHPLRVPYPFVPYQGVLVGRDWSLAPEHRRSSSVLRGVEFLLAEFEQQYTLIAFALHPFFEDIRAFSWFHYHEPQKNRFAVDVRYTGLLNTDALKNWEDYFVNLRRLRQREYRKAVTSGLSIEVSDDVESLLRLHVAMFERQDIRMPDLERRLLCSITAEMLRLKVGELLACRDAGGNLLAMTLFLYDSKSAYSLFGATDPAHRDSGTYTYLILENLHHCRDRAVERVDFVGINSPNRGDYKLSFNFKPTPYFLTTWEAP